MLPVKQSKTTFNKNYISIISFLIALLIVINIFENTLYKDTFILNYLYLDNLNNINTLGQSIYNYYAICFIIAGIILLISLIGSIVLTLKYNTILYERNLYIINPYYFT